MELTEALKKVEDDTDLKERLKGKSLCSALSFLKGWKIPLWELNYYDPRTHKITQVAVDTKIYIKSEGDPFKDADIPAVDISSIKISAKKALEIGKKYYEDKYKSHEIQRIFFALHAGKEQYWSISVITKYLSLVIINIDTESGKVISAKESHIFHKGGRAS